MKKASLKHRFFLNTTLVLLIVMIITAMFVDYRFRKEIETANKEKLRLHVFTLLSVVESNNGRLQIPPLLQNPMFNQVQSGLKAWVLDVNENVLWQSLSIEDSPPNVRLSDHTGQWLFSEVVSNDTLYHTLDYKIAWETQGNQTQYHFIIAKDSTEHANQITRFRFQSYASFFLVTALLLLCQFLVLRFAFRPIAHLESEIEQMEQGDQSLLSTNYPQELQGVSKNLNALIDKEYRQREKYRTSMADLAHSLKTPIAIINTELEDYPNNETLQNALVRVNQTIEYQLRRAVISGHSVLDNSTEVRAVFNNVASAIAKVYRDKNIDVQTNFNSDVTFLGDENDLLEVFGNLMDNAYKYSKSVIKVGTDKVDNTLQIIVEDDGPGFSKRKVEHIFARGERLDQKNLGQGIGLAVVQDIVNSYDGTITASTSELGGALFDIRFPLKGQ